MGCYLIQPITREIIATYGDQVLDYLAAAMDESPYEDDDPARVLDMAWKGEVELIEIVEDDTVIAVGTLEDVERKDGTYTNMWSMAGEDIDGWLEDYLIYVETRARALGHKGVILGGRMGWQRKLKRFGYRPEQVILKREFIQ